MSYIGPNNEFPYSFRKLRADNPDVSFPENPPKEVWMQYGALPAYVDARPEYNNETHELIVNDWVDYQDGKRRTWTVQERGA